MDLELLVWEELENMGFYYGDKINEDKIIEACENINISYKDINIRDFKYRFDVKIISPIILEDDFWEDER